MADLAARACYELDVEEVIECGYVTPSPSSSRKAYPTDVSDEEWAFVAPYLALVREDAPQRRHDLREAFNALRWLARGYERLAATLAGLHFLAFTCLMLHQFTQLTLSA